MACSEIRSDVLTISRCAFLRFMLRRMWLAPIVWLVAPAIVCGQAFSSSLTPLPDPAPVNQPSTAGGAQPMALSLALPSGVAVGRTKGAFSVSATGAAQYVIPLWSPPGIAGLQPSLALAYSSEAGDGLYGMGWNVAGLGTISRCAKTVAQDGIAANVFLTSGDLYCLNGNKLRSFGGTTYGADGAQYQTELADFSLVISHGTAGTGPAWFEVHAKNGLIYQYGHTTDSALLATGTTSVLMWALNSITDRYGNHIDFVYINDTTDQVFRPSTVTYTTPPAGASGVQTTPNYQVQFSYVSRSSQIPSGFIAGAQFLEPYLAQTITVAAWNGSNYAAQRTYNFSYTVGSATGRSTLHTVQECSPTQCFSPTTIGYQSGQTGWSSAVSVGGSSSSLISGMVVDLNGDGVDDIVYMDNATLHYYYLLGSTAGTYSGPYDTGVVETSNTLTPLDFNGDGKTDFLIENSSGNFRVLSFTTPGGAFSVTDTTIPYPVSFQVKTADIDGDGRDDLIYTVLGGNGKWGQPDYIYYRLNTGGGFGAQTLLAQIGTTGCKDTCDKLGGAPFGLGTQYNSKSHRADVNGDGRTDFFVSIVTCTLDDLGHCQTANQYFHWNLFVSDATTNTYDQLGIVNYGIAGVAGNQLPPLFGDFNGDGCTDVASNHAGVWYLQYGTCLRTGSTSAISAAVNTGVPAYGIYAMAVDWDGDGRDDIVDANSTTGTWGYAHSNGTSLDAWTSTGIAYNNSDTTYHAALVVDTRGDGHGGIVYPTGTGFTLKALPHNGPGITADLATSFTDGFNFTYSPSYTQLTNSTYYAKGSGATYPEQDYQSPRTIVKSYTVSDAISASGTYTISEYYSAARKAITGRGFEGFGYIRSLDSRNGLYTYTNYSLLFPLTGMVSEVDVKLASSGTLYRSLIKTNASSTLDATYKRYFPYVSQSLKSIYEYGGTLDGTLITQATTVYAYAGTNGFSYGNPSSITRTIVDKDPTSPWTTNTFTDLFSITPYEVGGTGTTGWCIHLPSQVSETRTQPGGANLTHTTAYSVNQNSNCEIDSATQEPASTTDKVVTSFAYTDGCGNVNSMSVTGQKPDGTGMTARTTTASYGAHCIFPEVTKDALLEQSSSGYDYNLGVRTSSTDPNNLSTGWQYNDIGQKILETRPDGTETSYALALCTSCSSFPAFTNYFATVTQLDSTAGHTAFQTLYEYFDPLDRRVATNLSYQSQGVISDLIVLDALGRAAKTSSPYFGATGTPQYTTNTYDPFNRLTSASRPISGTNPALEYTYYTYQGRTSTIKDPKGYVTTRQSDVIGELLNLIDPDGSSKTTYAYNPFGLRTQTKDPAGNQYNLTYDTLGYLQIGSSDPDRGTWVYQFDSLGELINLRDAMTTAPAWTQAYAYDALGRTTQRTESEGTTVWTWGTVATSHEIGRLKELSGLNDDELYTYDSAGRLASHSMNWASTLYTVSYNYNSIGSLNQLTYPKAIGQANAFSVLYGYTNGYLSSVKNYTGGVAGTTFWQWTPSVTAMDPWGHAIDETLGTTSAVRIQSGYDAVTGWVNTRTVGSGGSLNNLQNLAYQWDLNGNLSQRQELNQSSTEAITYDNLNRIQSSTLNGTQNLAVVIDNTGNITSRTEGGVTYPYTYDATHKHALTILGSVHTYAYDANGDMNNRDGFAITWTSFRVPNSINGASNVSSTFYYGPDHQRKQQVASYIANGTNGTETTTYVFGLYEHEVTPAQVHDKYFVQVPGGTQIVYDIQSVSGTQTTYVTADHLGSGSLFINASGSVLIHESYGAYGRRRTGDWGSALPATSTDYNTIASTTRRGYTDAFHEFLDNLTLIHMNGRVYDPIAGRFMSPDPLGASMGNSQSVNPYSYAFNRPLTLTDPSGMAVAKPGCRDTCPNLGYWCQKDPSCVKDVMMGLASEGTPPPSIGSVEGLTGYDVTGCQSCDTGTRLGGGSNDQVEYINGFNTQHSGGGWSKSPPKTSSTGPTGSSSDAGSTSDPSTATDSASSGASDTGGTVPSSGGGVAEVDVTAYRGLSSGIPNRVTQTGIGQGVAILPFRPKDLFRLLLLGWSALLGESGDEPPDPPPPDPPGYYNEPPRRPPPRGQGPNPNQQMGPFGPTYGTVPGAGEYWWWLWE